MIPSRPSSRASTAATTATLTRPVCVLTPGSSLLAGYLLRNVVTFFLAYYSFWMNILGYYVRLTNGVEAFDAEILSLVHTFLNEVIEVLCAFSPDIKEAIESKEAIQRQNDLLRQEESLAKSLSQRLIAYFDVFSTMWNKFVQNMYKFKQEQLQQSVQMQPPQQLLQAQQNLLKQQSQPQQRLTERRLAPGDEPPPKRQRQER